MDPSEIPDSSLPYRRKIAVILFIYRNKIRITELILAEFHPYS